MKKSIFAAILFSNITFASCTNNTGEHSKYKAYVYNQPEPDGLICVFYSNFPGAAEDNAQKFVEMYNDKFEDDRLFIRTEPY